MAHIPSPLSPPQTATNLLPVLLAVTPPTQQQISHISPPVFQPGTSTEDCHATDVHAAISGVLPLMSSIQLGTYSGMSPMTSFLNWGPTLDPRNQGQDQFYQYIVLKMIGDQSLTTSKLPSIFDNFALLRTFCLLPVFTWNVTERGVTGKMRHGGFASCSGR